MIKRMAAWLVVSASLYGLFAFVINERWQQANSNATLTASLSRDKLALAQANPDNTAPHRGSGRCENSC